MKAVWTRFDGEAAYIDDNFEIKSHAVANQHSDADALNSIEECFSSIGMSLAHTHQIFVAKGKDYSFAQNAVRSPVNHQKTKVFPFLTRHKFFILNDKNHLRQKSTVCFRLKTIA